MAGIYVKPYPKNAPVRIYANLSYDDKAAEMDLRTGAITVHLPDHATEAATKLAQWYIQHPQAVSAARKRRERPPLDPQLDFANNKPGQNLLAPEREARERDRRRDPAMARMFELARIDAGRTFRLGRKGERQVAKVIDRMARKTPWRGLHSIPLPVGGDIDHLLIGPDGVVAVDTKNHPKAKLSVSHVGIWVNGARTDHGTVAARLAQRASEVLTDACGFTVKVTPMVALVNGGINAPELTSSGWPDGLLVATRWNLPRVLWDMEDGLTDDQVDAIYEAARRPATWAAKRTAK